MKATQILTKICKDLKIAGPTVTKNRVKIGNTTYTFSSNPMAPMISQQNSVPVSPPTDSNSNQLGEEQMALAVLNEWPKVFGYRLVPEHIETRSLYHPDKPGIEQGQLEMWIDMFPMDMPQPPPPIDISPRKPKRF